EPFAHMVPNRATIGALLGALADRVEMVTPVEITGFAAEPGSARLTLRDGRSFRAPLVVAADGGNSALRAMAGIGTFSHDYRQSGIVTTIGHELDHEGTAYEHFRPAGPFASLPLTGRRSSLVWTETRDAAAHYGTLPPHEIALEIEAVMGSTLGKVQVDEPVQVF